MKKVLLVGNGINSDTPVDVEEKVNLPFNHVFRQYVDAYNNAYVATA
ncbi:MAG: hypothetical protein ABR936_07175 [Bacteroidota bacterium]|jgi:hypothetical protein